MQPAALLLCVSLLLSDSAAAQSQQSHDQLPKLGELNLYHGFLTAEGVWRPDSLNDNTELAFDAVTRIECHKHGGDELVDSDSYYVQMTASVILGMPDISVDYFSVLKWDREVVIAADSPTAPMPICTWTQITINLIDHSVMATDTRKLGKGHEGFNNACELAPMAQTYHLVDKGQKLIRRRTRAAKLQKQVETPK